MVILITVCCAVKKRDGNKGAAVYTYFQNANGRQKKKRRATQLIHEQAVIIICKITSNICA